MSPAALLPRLAEPGQPAALHHALDKAFQEVVGHRLFTLLIVAPGGREVERVYSSNLEAYPLKGRKQMGPTPWGAQVLQRGEPYLGDGPDAMAWAFPDHALIRSLGLGAAINLPVLYDGAVIGTANLLDAPGCYDAPALAAALPFAPLLIPGFLQARRSVSPPA